ncbi:hypothetical protein NUW58_g2530 [Xylaria curta]|uniref:Uncharacterized protein n=1 Tax=Xylaria curta TaxID=42375 RepID=A0ACC1PHH4_9PEZI|nr:hypothetical protein NUW58_g2530 [Xylaria curta]
MSRSLLAAGFDLLMRKPLRTYELYELFLGGPQTNIVALYAGLTEKEKSAYPRRLVEHAALEDDPRYNAIRNELKRRAVPLWLTEGREGLVIDFCKVIVKVVKVDEDEPSSAT